MKTFTKILSTCCFAFAASGTPLIAEVPELKKAIAGLEQASPLLRQNIRPITTLECAYREERSIDGGMTWEFLHNREVLLDFENKTLKVILISGDMTKSEPLHYREKLFTDGKVIELIASVEKSVVFKKERPFTYFPALSINPSENFFESVAQEVPGVAFNFVDIRKNLQLNDLLFGKPQEKGLLFKQSGKNTDEFIVTYDESTRFVISKSKGLVLRRISGVYSPDGEDATEMGTAIYGKHVYRDGIQIPTEIGIEVPEWTGIKIRRRYIITPELLKINKRYKKSDFMIKVPAGCYILDAVKNKRYKTEVPMNTLTFSDVEKELDELIEKANKQK